VWLDRPPLPAEGEAIHRGMGLLRAPGTERTLTVQNETVRAALRSYVLNATLGGFQDAEKEGLTDRHFMVFEMRT